MAWLCLMSSIQALFLAPRCMSSAHMCSQKTAPYANFFVFTPIVADPPPPALYRGLHTVGVKRN